MSEQQLRNNLVLPYN